MPKKVLAGVSMCLIAGILVAAALAVFGFVEIFRGKQKDEKSTTDQISRQIKGFGWLILAQVVTTVSLLVCISAGALAAR